MREKTRKQDERKIARGRYVPDVFPGFSSKFRVKLPDRSLMTGMTGGKQEVPH